jgi:C4-dicarboxylate-binding protein DctP
VIVNKKFWDKLPADVRTQLDSAMREASKYANTIAQQENDKALEAVKKAGTTTVYVPNEKEKAAWLAALLPVQKTMEDRIGKELIAAVNKATH